MINKAHAVRDFIRANYYVRDTFKATDIHEKILDQMEQKHVTAALSGLERRGFLTPATHLMKGAQRPIIWRLVKALPKEETVRATTSPQKPQKLAAKMKDTDSFDLSKISTDRLLLELRSRLK